MTSGIEARSEYREVLIAAAKDGHGVNVQPATKQRGIDGPEIDNEFQVTIVEAGEVGCGADQGATDRCPGEEDRTGRPVAGPSLGVFLHATAKF